MEKENIPDKCPHCGAKLSPWQKVLLSVDKEIMCKNCWYRIILSALDSNINLDENGKDSQEDDNKGIKDGNI